MCACLRACLRACMRERVYVCMCVPACIALFVTQYKQRMVDETIPLYDHLPVCTGSTKNFDIVLKFSDLDLGNVGPSSDTLGQSDIVPTLTPESVAQAGLLSGGSLTVSGLASVVLPMAVCPDMFWMCIHVGRGSNARYTDLTDDNNWTCKNKATQKSCNTGTTC